MHFDHKHRVVEFQTGDWVWLRLLHRPIASLDNIGRSKLGPKFYGPFRVTERIGKVAYKLILPEGTKLHNVFHVGLLKKYCRPEPEGPNVLPQIRHSKACPEPNTVIGNRTAQGTQELLG
jgi:hypothetical protein